METTIIKRYLPWLVASAMFMEQLDATIVNTAIPAMAESLGVTPLSLKAVVASYILSLAVCIPISGWMADRFGTKKVFAIAITGFTISSILCGLSINTNMLVAARIMQGASAAMMIPVGRITILRTFDKSELLSAMNFVIIPALIGPLLGPTIGGLIVHFASWRVIFFVNIPVGLIALWMILRYMPDYKGEAPKPLDFTGFILFGSGTALLSWILEIFGEHQISPFAATIWIMFAFGLLGAYVKHAQKIKHPLLNLSLFSLRTFRISVFGGFITRLGIGGLPFLLPLLYQIGLGLPAWQSGLLMMPIAIAAMCMKFISTSVLRQFGYRKVLIINTLLIGVTICLYSTVTVNTPFFMIVLLSLAQGFFNSLQFSSINSMAYADIETSQSSQASTIASSMQQLAMSFGLAFGSLVTMWYLGGIPQTNHEAVASALHDTFISIGILTMISTVSFLTLKNNDGESVSRSKRKEAQAQMNTPAA